MSPQTDFQSGPRDHSSAVMLFERLHGINPSCPRLPSRRLHFHRMMPSLPRHDISLTYSHLHAPSGLASGLCCMVRHCHEGQYNFSSKIGGFFKYRVTKVFLTAIAPPWCRLFLIMIDRRCVIWSSITLDCNNITCGEYMVLWNPVRYHWL